MNELTITALVNGGRSMGYVKAAECLQHWRSNHGRTKTVPSYWITKEKIVSRTINIDFRKYFVKEFGKKIRAGRVNLGQSITFEKTKSIRFGKGDLFYAFHKFCLIGIVSIKFKNKISETKIEGEITKFTVLGTDVYDWGTGVVKFLDLFEIDQKDFAKFEKMNGAQQYDIYLKDFNALYLLREKVFTFEF